MSAKWTILVYMAADNDLTEVAEKNLDRIAKTATSADLNVLILLDRRGMNTERYVVKNGAAQLVPNAEPRNENSGDPATLTGFLNWANQAYPADKVGLIVFNHGGGWEDPKETLPVPPPPPPANFKLRRQFRPLSRELPTMRDGVPFRLAIDKTAGDYLTSAEFREAIAKSDPLHKVHVLGVHACMMGMLEIGYEMRETADYFVASETVVHEEAWPYETFLGELAKDPANFSAEDLSNAMVNTFKAQQLTSTDFGTLANFKLKLVPDMAGAFDALAGALVDRWQAHKAALVLVRTKMVNQLKNPRYVDLGSLLDGLSTTFPDDAGLLARVEAVRTAVKAYIIAFAALGAEHQRKCGLSVWFPNDPPARDLLPAYLDLQIHASSHKWPDFLDLFLS